MDANVVIQMLLKGNITTQRESLGTQREWKWQKLDHKILYVDKMTSFCKFAQRKGKLK